MILDAETYVEASFSKKGLRMRIYALKSLKS